MNDCEGMSRDAVSADRFPVEVVVDEEAVGDGVMGAFCVNEVDSFSFVMSVSSMRQTITNEADVYIF